MQYGCIGEKLSHSYSPQIHSFLGAYSYELFEREPEEVGHFLQCSDFTAINVTIAKYLTPYCVCNEPLTKFAYMIARKFVYKLIDDKKMIIKEIKGIKSDADMREQEARINKLRKDAERDDDTTNEIEIVFNAGEEAWNE